jgi:hypothetical protein
MSEQFDKFAWFKAVYAESRFTSGEKAVLAHIAVINVLNGKGTFCVRQSTIASQCGITRRTVTSAVGRAKRLGYLVVTRLHTPGRSHHGADELRLSLPQWCEESSRHSGRNGEKQTTEWCEASSTNGEKQTTEWCEAANSPTSENDTPNSSGKQFSENRPGGTGLTPGVGSADPPPPINNSKPIRDDAPRCERHRDSTRYPTPPNCIACRDIRIHHEAQQQAATEQEIAMKTAIDTAVRAAIDNCLDCDDYGRLDNQAACPNHPSFRNPWSPEATQRWLETCRDR